MRMPTRNVLQVTDGKLNFEVAREGWSMLLPGCQPEMRSEICVACGLSMRTGWGTRLHGINRGSGMVGQISRQRGWLQEGR